MQILEAFSFLAFFFAFVGTTIANDFAQADAAQLNGADPNLHNTWATTDMHGPAAPTAPPEIVRKLVPVTLNQDIEFERVADTIPNVNCDADNNHYENLTGIRGEGDALSEECLTLAGWLRDHANWGRFRIRGDQWDKTGRDYTMLLWTEHCAFGAFRTDFQPEDLAVGAGDVAELIEVSVRHYSSPYVNPAKVEADGFMYCGIDVPLGWGLFNMNANEQHQYDKD